MWPDVHDLGGIVGAGIVFAATALCSYYLTAAIVVSNGPWRVFSRLRMRYDLFECTLCTSFYVTVVTGAALLWALGMWSLRAYIVIVAASLGAVTWMFRKVD